MNETTDSFAIDLYRSVLAQNNTEDNYKVAETERKCAALCFEAACKNSDVSACDVLSHRLDTYTRAVYKDGKNIYNSLLHEIHPNISNKRQFKVPKNLPKTNLNSYLKDLDCSDGKKFFCVQSEKTNQSELDQFTSFFNCIKRQVSKPTPLMRNQLNSQERLDNFDELQGIKQIGFGTLKNIPTYAKEVSQNRENTNSFVSARNLLGDQVSDKLAMDPKQMSSERSGNTGRRKKLNSLRTGRHKFVSPLLSKEDSASEEKIEQPSTLTDSRLKNIEPKMVELIMAEIMDQGPSIGWDDIAGLEFAKSAIQEAVVWPMLRPDIFIGLRRPPKGILLFGPPGTGKTLIGKCVASQSKSTFFCISASSLTSKWIGDGEKMVRALFAVARVHQPAVIFIDEVDSLLTQRSDTEHESSRRIKTEFLVQLDGASTDNEERLLVIGATNRPHELDEAARRRFVKRLYIPLPEYEARFDLLKKLMLAEKHSLTEEHFSEIARLSEGYSGADIKNLCSEAALGPIRSIDFRNIENIQASEVRPLTIGDFKKSLDRVRPSVSQNDLVYYVQWNKTYGSGSNV